MKTKLKIVALTIVFVASILLHTRTSEQSGVIVANVEALANWEGGGNVSCIYSGSVDCPISNVKVYKVY